MENWKTFLELIDKSESKNTTRKLKQKIVERSTGLK